MGIPFRSGRTFAVSDPADAIIIDETMARRFWPSESAIGRRIRAYGQVQTVIGVVGAVHHARLGDSEQPTVYFPYSRMATREMSLVIGTGAADPATLAEPVRQVIRSLDPTIPLPDIATMTARITRSTSPEAYRTILLGCFGLAATLLTVLGIFGVTARTVNQQRQEIGVRIALGASRWTIMRQVLRHQLLSLVAGISIGATVVWMISPLLARFVFRIGPFDPVTLLAAVALLGGAGVAGAGLPASAASRFDPARLIRSD